MGGRLEHDHTDLLLRDLRVLPRDRAIQKIKDAIQATYGRKGEAVVERNFAAVDGTLEHLFEVPLPEAATADRAVALIVPADAPVFGQHVTAMMMAGAATSFPSAPCPQTARIRRAPASGRSGTLRPRCRVEGRIPSSAATA